MSATWDSKSVKATPVLADELLLIDTEDSRNQKRATLLSLPIVWDRNAGSGFIFPITLTDIVGIGTNTPATTLHSRSIAADTAALVTRETTGANGGITKTFVGNRDPNANVTGSGGEEYLRDSGATSKRYLSREATTGTAWDEYSTNPPNILEIKTAADFDDLASGGVVTISTDTTFVMKSAISTANRIVINSGITLHIVSNGFTSVSLTYTGTDTFITSVGGTFNSFASTQLIASSSSATLLSISGGGQLVIENSAIIGWGSLGTFSDGLIINRFINVLNCLAGLTLTNPSVIAVASVGSLNIGTELTGALYTFTTNNPDTLAAFVQVAAIGLESDSAAFDFDTRIDNSIEFFVERCTTINGSLFKQTSVANATINSVVDSSPSTGTITAFADDVTGISTTVSSTTTYFEDEEVTISGTTSYNGTFQIFGVVAGVSFKIRTAFVADDATGSIISNRIDMTLAGGHGVTTGMNIKVIDTNFYNAFYTVLNVATNIITLNQVFVATDTGEIERNVSIDETDPRIKSVNNLNQPDSHKIATAFRNDNATANGTIINNVFTDMVFGTAGTALLSGTTMERWKLVDELNGTFEYIGNETFDGVITYDFTVTSSGGTVDFRFKWQKSITTTITATTIAFVNSNPDTITDSGNGFLTAGFQAGDTISVSGSTSNDGNYTIDTVVAGTITLVASDTLAVESAGATVTINGLFGNLADNVEGLVAVGNDAQSTTKHFPLLANKGIQIKPQITRNSGGSTIITSYATVYAIE